MSLALAGILSLQLYSLRHMILLNEELFAHSVYLALEQIVSKVEQEEIEQTARLYNLPKPNELGLNPVQITRVEEISSFLQADSSKAYSSSELSPEDLQNLSGKFFAKEERMNWKKGNSEAFMTHFTTYFTHHTVVQDIPLERRKSLEQLDSILREALLQQGIYEPCVYAVYSVRHQQIVLHNSNYSRLEAKYKEAADFAYKAQLFPSANEAIGTLLIDFPTRVPHSLRGVFWQMLGIVLFSLIIVYSFYYTLKVLFRQKKLSEMKNDFVNNMTHEFKTPIATISIATDTISHWLKVGKPEKAERFISIIKQENKRMHSQVEKVLQMAQIERREFSLSLKDIDVHELIHNVVEKMSLQVEKKGGNIALDLQATHYLLQADETHLTNMLSNLLDNANKYSPQAPDIRVESQQGLEGELILLVHDKGLGISKEAKAHIFDKFYRVSTGNLHDVKGFGLGLSYVQAMMQAHGGRVELQSSLGKGSCFSLVFPAKNLTFSNP